MRRIPEWRPWYEVVCDLCGMVVEYDLSGSTSDYPSRCEGNAGGHHYPPRDENVIQATRPGLARSLWLRQNESGAEAQALLDLTVLDSETGHPRPGR